MASFYYGPTSHPPAGMLPNMATANHHSSRSRRIPRLPSLTHQHSQIKPRNSRSPKEMAEQISLTSFRRDFEAARSFDLEDDELFCPFRLLTEDDLCSIRSSSSDRSSMSSGSPDSSPLQLQPTPGLVLPTSALSILHPYPSPSILQASSQPKLYQPLAQRARNAIPIVDPSTGSVTSPPPSVSPGSHLHHHFISSRRW